MTDSLYSAKHWANKAQEACNQATLAVAQVGSGIVPVICCKSSAPTAETLYKVEKTSFAYVHSDDNDYGYVRTSGSSGDPVAANTAVYWDKRGIYQSCTTAADTMEFEYTGTTQVNSISENDMYYNTTDNKIYTFDGTSWGNPFTVTSTILVLDQNTNKLMHLFDGKLEGVYRL